MNKYKENISLKWSNDSIRIINTPSHLARSAYFYTDELGYFKTDSQYYTEREYLNSYLFIYTISGKGTLNYNNKFYTILPNQLVFIDCMDYHYYSTAKNTEWEFLWIHFNGSTSHGYYDQFKKCESPIVTITNTSIIYQLLKDLLEINIDKNIATELLSSKLIISLLTETILNTNLKETIKCSIPEIITKVIAYMNKNFTDKITLDTLSKVHCIDKFYLSKEFKKHTGFSPNEYIINLRINYAKELLKYSYFTISEISMKIGIDNTSHFINLFRKREKITPLSFRKVWQMKAVRTD